jgi:hypothetical protein
VISGKIVPGTDTDRPEIRGRRSHRAGDVISGRIVPGTDTDRPEIRDGGLTAPAM